MIQVKTNNESPYPFPSSSPAGMTGGHQMHPMALAEYHQRLQLYDYAQQAAMRLRMTQSALNSSQQSSGASVFGMAPHPALTDAASPFSHMSPFSRFDPRFRYVHEEPKPPHSYIGLIAMAILSNADRKMVLSDIYQYILDHYPYFRNRGPGWRNSIRHNLSLNDCFVKAGRSANGKGHYWAIHPANVDDFRKGDFRRRKAQRKVRKHMGLSVPEDEDSSSPTPTPVPSAMPSPFIPNRQAVSPADGSISFRPPQMLTGLNPMTLNEFSISLARSRPAAFRGDFFDTVPKHRTGKRLFDVESLLAPDCDSTVNDQRACEVIRKKEKTEENEPLDITTHDSSPRSTNSPNEFACQTESNCSSPSVSSSNAPSPQPLTPSKRSSDTSDTALSMKSSGIGGSSARNQNVYGGLTPWQVAQIQSLHNLQQMNSSLLSGQGIRCESGFTAWAAMSALAAQSQPSSLLSYSAAFAAASIENPVNNSESSQHHPNNSSSVVLSSRGACNQK